MTYMLAFARVWTVLALVAIAAYLVAPSPGMFQPTALDKLPLALVALGLLGTGWLWLRRIRAN